VPDDDERPEPAPGGWLPPSDREYVPPEPLPEEPAGAHHGWEPPSSDTSTWDDRPAPWIDAPASADGPPRPNNGKATASLALGIGGLLVCPLVLSVLAIVLGLQARKEIDRSGGRQRGRGNATAGVVTGGVGLVLGIVVIVLVAAGVDLGLNFQTSD
jgi:hypothetical protein